MYDTWNKPYRLRYSFKYTPFIRPPRNYVTVFLVLNVFLYLSVVFSTKDLCLFIVNSMSCIACIYMLVLYYDFIFEQQKLKMPIYRYVTRIASEYAICSGLIFFFKNVHFKPIWRKLV